MSTDEILGCVPTDTGRARASQLHNLCVAVFRETPEGRLLLNALCTAIPPMAPSMSDTGANDPVACGVREGRRDMVAFLFRFSGCPPSALAPYEAED